MTSLSYFTILHNSAQYMIVFSDSVQGSFVATYALMHGKMA